MTTHIHVQPRMHGLQQACRNALVPLNASTSRPPGRLDEYPSRVEHARAHRLRSEIRRRDRRRARTSRAPIRFRGRARPRMLAITNALASVGPAFERAGQAAREFADAAGPALIAMQQRINEMVQAIATATVPHRFTAGGRIGPPRAPDDDTILAFISPGEVYVPPGAVRHYESGLLQHINAPTRTDSARVELDAIQDGLEELIGWRPAVAHVFALAPADPEITHYDRYLGEGNLERDETSGRHSLDSSGTGAVWTDLMTRIDDLVDGEE